MRPGRQGPARLARDGQNVAPQVQCEGSRVQGAARGAAFDDHDGVGERCYQAIARRKAPRHGRQRPAVLRQQHATLDEVGEKAPIGARNDETGAAAQHADEGEGQAALTVARTCKTVEGAHVSLRVDAQCHAAHHVDPGAREPRAQQPGHLEAIRGRMARADDGHGRARTQGVAHGLPAPSAYEQGGRRVVQVAQARWVVGVGPGHDRFVWSGTLVVGGRWLGIVGQRDFVEPGGLAQAERKRRTRQRHDLGEAAVSLDEPPYQTAVGGCLRGQPQAELTRRLVVSRRARVFPTACRASRSRVGEFAHDRGNAWSRYERLSAT